MRLILVRHGQSFGNVVTEDMPDPPLTPLGVEHAELVKEHLKHTEIHHVLASPLVRSLGTAHPLAEELDLPITVWRDLQEVRNARLSI